MTMHLALLCVLQQMTVTPYPAEVGQEVVVRVTAASGGTAGLPVTVLPPGGVDREAGATDDAGEFRFTPDVVGRHRFATSMAGVRVVAPLDVVEPQRRWLYAVICLPLGLALASLIWRSRSRPAA